MPTTLQLDCLIEGEDKVFTVTAEGDDKVSKLKNKIKNECAVTFEGVDARHIELWKVNIDINAYLNDGHPLSRLKLENLDPRSIKPLQSWNLTSKYWSEPPPDEFIQIIVKGAPAATISPSSSNDPVSSTDEYQKLHSDHPLYKLWMLAREPQQTLFEIRPVQRDNHRSKATLPSDYMVLKGGDWLWDIQPDSRFTGVLIRDEYWEALRAIIKWFSNEVTGDDMEVDDIKPATSANPFLGATFASKPRSFILVGDPGIGKTAFLYVLLVLRLQARLPTIYQSQASYLYYFADDGVYQINLTPRSVAKNFKSRFHQSTWCLIDSNQTIGTVPTFIQELDRFIVQACSPRPQRFAWRDKTTRRVKQYCMKSWTLPELLVGRVLQDEVYSEEQIELFSTRYSTSAHLVYIHALDPLEYETTLLLKMGTITYEHMATLFSNASGLDLSGDISHQLISISPGAARNAVAPSFATRYIYQKFRDKLSTRKLEAAARLYDMLVRNPYTRTPAGYMLEDAANDVFYRGGEWSLVPLTRSTRTGPKFTHWKAPDDRTTTHYFHLGYVGHHITIDTAPHLVGTEYTALPLKHFLPNDPAVQLVDGYYCPSSRFQETFDAFIYESVSKTATVLQVTTVSSHSVKEGGVKWLQDLGVKRFRYIAVTTPDTPIDLPFPNVWDASTGPSIPEKYLLAVESLPEY